MRTDLVHHKRKRQAKQQIGQSFVSQGNKINWKSAMKLTIIVLPKICDSQTPKKRVQLQRAEWKCLSIQQDHSDTKYIVIETELYSSMESKHLRKYNKTCKQ